MALSSSSSESSLDDKIKRKPKLKKLKKKSSTNYSDKPDKPQVKPKKKKKKKKEKPLLCDICFKSTKAPNLQLLACTDCKLLVHDGCYGVTSYKEGDAFKCLACQAVGKTVQVRERDDSGNRISITQMKRPTECILCSVSHGLHAMHPVYDGHGKRGRQILLFSEDEKHRRKLAWAHTVCISVVNRLAPTTGCLYGCTADGVYEGEDDNAEDENISDSESVNPDLDVSGVLTDITHYVYWGYYDRFFRGKPNNDQWAKCIHQAKTQLKCVYCGKVDSEEFTWQGYRVYRSLRIPVQCAANNPDEYFSNGFPGCHRDRMPCTQALHVGCAMWGRNDSGEYSQVRRVYFNPFPCEGGLPITDVYCQLHADDIYNNLDRKKCSGACMLDKLPGPFAPPPKVTKSKKQPAIAAAASLSAKRLVSSMASRKDAPEKAAHRVSASSKQQRQPTGARKKLSKKTSASSPRVSGQAIITEEDSVRVDPSTGTVGITLYGQTRKKRPNELMVAGRAVAVQSEKEGRLVTKRKSVTESRDVATSAVQAPTNEEATESGLDFSKHKGIVEGMLQDLQKERKNCQAKNMIFSAESTVKFRLRWSRKTGHLRQESFHKLWNAAKEAVLNNTVEELQRELKKRKRPTDSPEMNAMPNIRQPRKKQKPAIDNEDGNIDRLRVPRRSSQCSAGGNVEIERRHSRRQEIGEAEGQATSYSHSYQKKKTTMADEEEANAGKEITQRSNKADHKGDRLSGDNNSRQEPSHLDGAGEERASKSVATHVSRNEPIESYHELIEKISSELVIKLAPFEDFEETRDEHRESVRRILIATKRSWRKTTGLSKAEYSTLFNGVLAVLVKRLDWLSINGHGEENVSGEGETAQEVEIPPQHSNLDANGCTDRSNEGISNERPINDPFFPDDAYDNNEIIGSDDLPNNGVKDADDSAIFGSGEASNEPLRSQHRNESTVSGSNFDGVELRHEPSPSLADSYSQTTFVSPWAFLCYGRQFEPSKFEFDEWDTIEDVELD